LCSNANVITFRCIHNKYCQMFHFSFLGSKDNVHPKIQARPINHNFFYPCIIDFFHPWKLTNAMKFHIVGKISTKWGNFGIYHRWKKLNEEIREKLTL